MAATTSKAPKRRRVAGDIPAATPDAPVGGSSTRPPPGEWSLDDYEDFLVYARPPHLGDKCELWFDGVDSDGGAW